MPEPAGSIDRRAVRRRFDRAAAGYAQASPLEAEVGRRMLARLDYVRLAPRRILDAGCGPSRESRALAKRYAGACVVALDLSVAQLQEARRGARGLRRLFGPPAPLVVSGGLEHMPLASASVDLVWSNMALHWASPMEAALREMHRVLRPGGLAMFSTLGPDSLKELRAAAGASRVHTFADMHDVGDALVHAGFGAPVMDMEVLTLTYPHPRAFLAELRAAGQTSALRTRCRALTGKGFRRPLQEALEAQMRDGRLAVTCEVVYGHAWRGTPRTAAGEPAIMRFDRSPHQKN
ncbi:MAG TPA: methyltransferase domain-containing protein [Burkholderiales bacterium]